MDSDSRYNAEFACHIQKVGLDFPLMTKFLFSSHEVLCAKIAPREYLVQGLNSKGRRFRPSDWSERLCGVLSSFGPGATGLNARLKYSSYVRPVMIGDIKCVIVDERLRDVEPMAFEFVMNFARDNDLQVSETCCLSQ